MRLNTLLATLLTAGFLSACAMSPTTPMPAKMAGGVMVDNKGMTLYTFDRDTASSGKSVCNGPCAALWPPLMASADAKPSGDWTVVTRDDGGKQWAYKGKPLYLYANDKKAGDMTGDKFRDVWHVIK